MQKALETVKQAEEEAQRRAGVLRGVVVCASKKLAAQHSEIHQIWQSLLLLAICFFPLLSPPLYPLSLPLPGHLQRIVISLGADWHWSLDQSCTHYVYQVVMH